MTKKRIVSAREYVMMITGECRLSPMALDSVLSMLACYRKRSIKYPNWTLTGVVRDCHRHIIEVILTYESA